MTANKSKKTGSQDFPQRNLSIEEVRYELSRQRILVRSWITTVPESRRKDLAALFTASAFCKFATILKPQAVLSEQFYKPFGKLDSSARLIAEIVGNLIAKLPFQEATYFISSLYTVLLSSHERSSLGAFYTPPALANRLIELAEESGIDWASDKILDPACGGGAFLIPVAAKMLVALSGSNHKIVASNISSRLRGLELDPHAAWIAQASLELLLSDFTSGKLPQMVQVCDTLEEPPLAKFDLIIGNPPYGRVNLTAEQRTRYSRSLYGHANLYGVFTDIALRWTNQKGVVAYLTPTSFLGGQYFSSLRSLLASECPPTAIDFVHSRKGVFEDVLQETMLAIYMKKPTSENTQVHYLNVRNERDAELVKNGTIQLPKNPSDPWLAPRSPEQSKIAEKASRMTTRLKDWGYHVSTGPLVWNRFKDQLCTKNGKNRHPLIWAESISADGTFKFSAEKRNHTPYFEIKEGDDWLVTTESCVLLQRTTAKEQSRRLIAAELPKSFIKKHTAVIIENHLNMIKSDGSNLVTAAAVAAVLNSKIVDEVFRCISGSVAVSAFELEALPLPSKEQMKTIEKLVKCRANSESIEAALEKIYGM